MVKDYPNFISKSEIETIKQGVYSLKEYWKHSSKFPNSQLQQFKGTPIEESLFKRYRAEHLLGDALYRLEGKKENINLRIQLLLLKKFDWLYNKLINKITEITSIESELDPELTVPGFHVYAGYPQPFNKFNYHVDTSILDYYPTIDTSKIYSFVSLIECNGTAPYLDYKTGTKEYKLGTLHTWSGNLNHRIGGFELKEGDSRITLQGHYYYDSNSKTNKLFF